MSAATDGYDDLFHWIRNQPSSCGTCGFHVARQGHAPGCPAIKPGDRVNEFSLSYIERETLASDGIPVHLREEVARRGVEDVPLPEPAPKRIERPW